MLEEHGERNAEVAKNGLVALHNLAGNELGVEIATLLLPDKGGCTPSEMARLEGHLNVSKMLLDDLDKNKRMMTQQQQQTTAATVPSAEV